GDLHFLVGTGTLSLTVSADGTSTALTTSPNPSVFGQTVTLSATVSNLLSGGPTPTGTVMFVVDAGSQTLTANVNGSGVASVLTNALPVGAHTIVANYLPANGNFAASSDTRSQTVLTPSVTVVSSSLNPSVFGQSVTFTATVSPATGFSGTPTGSVTFTIDGTPQSPAVTLSGGKATLTVSNPGGGTHGNGAPYSGGPTFGQNTTPP